MILRLREDERGEKKGSDLFLFRCKFVFNHRIKGKERLREISRELTLFAKEMFYLQEK